MLYTTFDAFRVYCEVRTERNIEERGEYLFVLYFLQLHAERIMILCVFYVAASSHHLNIWAFVVCPFFEYCDEFTSISTFSILFFSFPLYFLCYFRVLSVSSRFEMVSRVVFCELLYVENDNLKINRFWCTKW